MVYYQARTSSDPKVIGVNNGIQQVEISNLATELVQFFTFQATHTDKFLEPPFQPQFPSAHPLTKAIWTDFLSYGPYLTSCPFMMSQDAIDSFKGFKAQRHYFYEVPISPPYSSYKYYIFYCPSLSYDVFDFSSSTFYAGSNLVRKEYIKLNSHGEFIEFIRSNERLIIRPEKLVLSQKFDKSLDVFSLRFGGVYFSERLVNKIEQQGLSGLTFRKCSSEKAETPESIWFNY